MFLIDCEGIGHFNREKAELYQYFRSRLATFESDSLLGPFPPLSSPVFDLAFCGFSQSAGSKSRSKGWNQIPKTAPAHAATLPRATATAPTFRIKIMVPVKEHPEFDFVRFLVGYRGHTLNAMKQRTGAAIHIRGRGSTRELSNLEPLNVIIEGTADAVALATAEIQTIFKDPQGAWMANGVASITPQFRDLSILDGGGGRSVGSGGGGGGGGGGGRSGANAGSNAKAYANPNDNANANANARAEIPSAVGGGGGSSRIGTGTGTGNIETDFVGMRKRPAKLNGPVTADEAATDTKVDGGGGDNDTDEAGAAASSSDHGIETTTFMVVSVEQVGRLFRRRAGTNQVHKNNHVFGEAMPGDRMSSCGQAPRVLQPWEARARSHLARSHRLTVPDENEKQQLVVPFTHHHGRCGRR